MKKTATFILMTVLLLSLVPLGKLASAMYGEKILDGSIAEWGTLDHVATAKNNGLAGANLRDLYIAWDDEYLYIAITTRNSASWDVAYGIGIDVDPGTGNGYTGTSDAWGRRISFGGGYAADYELYFWWSGGDGKITADNFIAWTGGGWDYKGVKDVGGDFVYTGDSSSGLQLMEIKIPWSALGGKRDKIAIVAWIAGGGESSAVSALPWDSTMESLDAPYAWWYGGDEWGDTDYFTELTEVAIAPKNIDGNLDDWENYEVVGVSSLDGPDGADVGKLYVSYDDQYLYLALTTNNTASWDVAYGIGIDVDPGTGNGYMGDLDSWGRKIGFSKEYAVDYELYFWWSGGGKSITSANFNRYEGDMGGEYWKNWDYNFAGFNYAYTGGDSGLQTLEIRIPWNALGGNMPKLAIMAWVAGGDGSSAVDTVPDDPAVDGNDWVDQDQLSNFAVIEIPIPKPELTVKLTSNVLDVEPREPANLTIDVRNLGTVEAKNVTVALYDNDKLLTSWIVNLSAGGNASFWYVYEYPGMWGTHVFKAVVDPDNTVEEFNEDNNVDTVTLDVGRLPKLQNTFVMHNMFYGTRHFEKDYPRYNELDQQLRNMPLPEDAKERLDEIQNEVLNLVKLYNEGKDMITQPNYAFMGAMKIYRAYTGLKKIIREMEEMLRKAQEGEYEHEKYMEELAKNLTKNIDGNLDDWSVEPVAVDDTGFGQDGANLKALYVDYDNQFLYIALTTENKASWRVAYGIALDYKDGGYTTGADAWGRKVSFTDGVDAQLYFFWNGEFFGDLGTSNITSAQLVLWNGTAWKYEDLKWVGFYAYTGGAENGLQTLEIAVPWTAIGGEPEKLRIVAYVTGQGSGDSAVDVLPLQEAVKDNAPGDEWGDADTFSEFAVVTIE